MKRRWILFTALLICLAIPGCSVHKVVGKWRSEEITIDGSDAEWSGEPQLDDAKREMMVRLLSDDSSIFLCVTFGDGELARQMQHDGLTIWIDPEGGKKRVFGIHLPGMRPHFSSMPPFRDDGQTKDKNSPPPPMDPGKAPVMPLGSISITYADTTGPLKMDMEEVRKTGLDIGVGRGNSGRWIYEFDISFEADSCLANLGPGAVIGIAIQSGGAEKDGGKPPSMGSDDGGMGGSGPGGGTGGPGGPPGGGMGGGPPGGGMGGGPPGGGMGGGPPGGGDSNEFEIWIRATLGVGPMA